MYDTAVLKTLVSIFDHKRLWCSVENFNVNVKQNVRENRMGNQEWTIQRNWQHCLHKTHDEDKQENNT